MRTIYFLIFFLTLTACSNSEKINEKCTLTRSQDQQCENSFKGVEFNQISQRCEGAVWKCNEPPFKTLEDCKEVCK